MLARIVQYSQRYKYLKAPSAHKDRRQCYQCIFLQILCIWGTVYIRECDLGINSGPNLPRTTNTQCNHTIAHITTQPLQQLHTFTHLTKQSHICTMHQLHQSTKCTTAQMQLHKQQTTLIKLGRIMRTPNGQLQTAHRTAFDKLKTVENAQLTPPCIVGENFFLQKSLLSLLMPCYCKPTSPRNMVQNKYGVINDALCLLKALLPAIPTPRHGGSTKSSRLHEEII